MSKAFGWAAWRKLPPFYSKLEDKDLPWVKSWCMIRDRCSKNGKYTKKGIKNLISPLDLRRLWFRDKAFKMKRPTVDRKDAKGHYEISNCRYLEYNENSRLKVFTEEHRELKSKQMKKQWKNPAFRKLRTEFVKSQWQDQKFVNARIKYLKKQKRRKNEEYNSG